ncbi:MAG: ECF-type sigma factor [Acidobacteriota bacterium]
MKEGQGGFTEMLHAYSRGHAEAFDQLFALVYDQLKMLARRQLRGRRPGQTLCTTALVHEAYLKLSGGAAVDYQDRGHFFAVAARAMRQIAVDFARRKLAGRRGGGAATVPADEIELPVQAEADRVLRLDRALDRLGETHERMARIVECRCFAGFTEEETASSLGLSLRTVQRDWLEAKRILRDELSR